MILWFLEWTLPKESQILPTHYEGYPQGASQLSYGLDWSLLHLFVLKVSMEHVLIKLVKCIFGFTKYCGCKFSWNWIFSILCFCVQHYALLIHYCLYIYFQSVATFFSQVMSAIGGNTAGPGFCCFSLLFALCICHLMFKILVLAAVSFFGVALHLTG